jgi:hypothetical protein
VLNTIFGQVWERVILCTLREVILDFWENNYHLKLARGLKRKKMQQIDKIKGKSENGPTIAGIECYNIHTVCGVLNKWTSLTNEILMTDE